jgi:hypothetical protein
MNASLQIDDGRPKIVGQFAFCAPNSVEGADRDFQITVYQDRTCTWDDESENRVLSNAFAFIAAAGNMEPIPGNAAGPMRHSFTSIVGEEVCRLIAEKEARDADGIEPTEEECNAIDAACAPYFWKHINSQLRNPLHRRPS